MNFEVGRSQLTHINAKGAPRILPIWEAPFYGTQYPLAGGKWNARCRSERSTRMRVLHARPGRAQPRARRRLHSIDPHAEPQSKKLHPCWHGIQHAVSVEREALPLDSPRRRGGIGVVEVHGQPR